MPLLCPGAWGPTVSCHGGVFRGLFAQCLCGSLQLLPQPADVAVRLGPHDAELGVDVLVLVTGVLLFLRDKGQERMGIMARPGGSAISSLTPGTP